MSTQEELATQFRALLAAGLEQATVLGAMSDHFDQYPDYAAQVETDDDLEVDDKPLYSAGEDGVWISAWVHIPHPAGEDSGDDE